MKKKISMLLSVILVSVLTITGCSYMQKDSTVENNENGKFEEYYDARVQYVGNNSEVSHLLNLLGVDDLGEYTIALKTDKEPYGLTIQYSKLKNNGDKEKFKIMDRIDYAYFVLALIDNLNDVDVNYETVNYHLTMDEANKMVNGSIKDYGSSPEKLKKLYDILNPKDWDYELIFWFIIIKLRRIFLKPQCDKKSPNGSVSVETALVANASPLETALWVIGL